MCFCPDVNTNHRCTAFYNKILALGIILLDGFGSLKPGSFKITGYQMTCDYYGMYTLLLKMLIDIWRYKIHLKNNLKVSCVMFLTRRQFTLSVTQWDWRHLTPAGLRIATGLHLSTPGANYWSRGLDERTALSDLYGQRASAAQRGFTTQAMDVSHENVLKNGLEGYRSFKDIGHLCEYSTERFYLKRSTSKQLFCRVL